MSKPKDKDRKKQGSSGRPGTKFMERPGVESDAGMDPGQFGDEGILNQQEKPDEETRESENGDNWKYANPDAQAPDKKKDSHDKGGQKQQGGQGSGEQDLGKD